MPATKMFPEDIVIATLHAVGSETKLVDDERLATAFDKAAQECPLFSPFRKHPQYGYSRLLSEALQTLDLGGGIVRDNAPLQYFRVSKHVVGDYGKSKWGLLQSPAEKKAVRKVAETIRSVFGGSE